MSAATGFENTLFFAGGCPGSQQAEPARLLAARSEGAQGVPVDPSGNRAEGGYAGAANPSPVLASRRIHLRKACNTGRCREAAVVIRQQGGVRQKWIDAQMGHP